MQKSLLPYYFLIPIAIGLCLAGSPALAEVAHSPSLRVPGADSLHRFSGPHRGGETRSDVLFKYDDGSELARLPLPSGGPWEDGHQHRGVGLVDQNWDSGAGEGLAQAQPASVTVFAHATPAIPHPAPVLGAAKASVIGHPTSSDFIPSTNQKGQAYLYLELEGGPTQATYQTHLWKRIGTAGFSPESAQTIISEVSPRDFFRGMLPTVSASLDIQTGALESPTYMAVSSKEGFLFNPFLIFPGDSALIRVNQQSGKIQFSGPASEELLLQYQLQLALENVGFAVDQLVTVPDRQKYLASNGNREKIKSAKSKFGRRLVVLQKGEEELAWLDDQFKASDFPQSIGLLVAAYQGSIPDVRLHSYQADILGKFFANYCRQLTRIIPDLTEKSHPRTEKFLSDLKSEFEVIQGNHWHLSGVVEFWLALSDAHMKLQSRSSLVWIGALEPGYPRDLLVEHYFYSKGKSIENLDEQLEAGLAMVEDPRVKAKLSHIKATRSLGSPILPMDLLTTADDTVQLDQWKNQVVLLEFWLSGCGACLTRYQKILKPLGEYFSGDPRFRMVAVSADRSKSRWESNIGTYTSVQATNVIALPAAFESLQEYGIDSYPGFLLLGKDAQILKVSGFPNELEKMIDLIKKSLDEEFSPISQAPNQNE